MIDDPNEPDDDTLEEVARYASEADAHEHALVVLAMGQACKVNEQHGIQVEPTLAEATQQELRCYDEEQASPAATPAPANTPLHPAGWPLYLLWASILSSTHLFKQRWPSLTDIGASSSIGLIDHGEWWRPFTSLFLHADVPHLLGNLISGVFFCTLVSKSIGPVRGWLWILICGTLGNLSTSLTTYPEPFLSIGASTAVFASLGILAGFGLAVLLHHHSRLPWLRIISPVLAGVVVLGMIGGNSTDGQTDVLGHVFGFAAGLPTGYLHGWFSRPSRMHRIAES